MKDPEKLLETLRDLLYNSKGFTALLCVVLVLATIAFPTFMLWIFATTVVFLFIKGMILILEMINNR